ncbi:hypothetical protein [Alkalilimnicola sp. S0819]|uniref:hypothetical protein n=1 Tax=Alkalilimnicola sp. S0819 TaxID=2613922 RepID=UPI001261769E|nr:hypothetical protein [Alkalilimnicola sp. S0819]KAB7623403.1 hypothetical protein F3N43_09910 [Alkalilimnicola sp. S0819]MPQ16949.1 hypothetical protein [Alkalilimnicola sp. S0819]
MDKSRFPVPIDPAVAQAVDLLGEDAREFFEERAALIEFDGGIPRIDAERYALEQTREEFGLPLP